MKKAPFFLLILFMITGCNYYKMVTLSDYHTDSFLREIISETYPDNKYYKFSNDSLLRMFVRDHHIFILYDTSRWLLDYAVIAGNSISGQLRYKPTDSLQHRKMPENRKSKRYNPEKERYITERVNLYVDSLVIDSAGWTTIVSDQIRKCDVYSEDKKKTFWRAFGLIMSPLIALVLYTLIAESIGGGAI